MARFSFFGSRLFVGVRSKSILEIFRSKLQKFVVFYKVRIIFIHRGDMYLSVYGSGELCLQPFTPYLFQLIVFTQSILAYYVLKFLKVRSKLQKFVLYLFTEVICMYLFMVPVNCVSSHSFPTYFN